MDNTFFTFLSLTLIYLILFYVLQPKLINKGAKHDCLVPTVSVEHGPLIASLVSWQKPEKEVLVGKQI